MKTIIAGCRAFYNYDILQKAILESGFFITEVVCGGANGVDTLGAKWAYDNQKSVRYFKAEWDKHGKAAGPIRNKKMAEYAEALIALPSKSSIGTRDMINKAKARGLKIFIYEV